MTALLRTLAIIACVHLSVQTVRHAYVLWLEPRGSVFDKFDRPLSDEIAAAESIDVLLRRYTPVRQDVDRIRAERRAADPSANVPSEQDAEPFKSEIALRDAIINWEQRSREIHSLRFYWLVGVVLAAAGMVVYRRGSRWTGVSLLIIGFSEMIYSTTPPFFSGRIQEFERLVATKLALSAVSLALSALTIHLLGVFRETSGKTG